MMIPRQAPLTGASAAVLDKRKREGGRAEPAETVALAAGGRDLPARVRSAGRAAKGLAAAPTHPTPAGGGGGEYETESATLAGCKREAARCREIGLLARKLGHD